MEKFSKYDLDMNERVARIEGKIDILLKAQTDHLALWDNQWKKIDDQIERVDEHDKKLAANDAEKNIYWRMVTPALSLISGAMGALIIWLKTR